MDKQSSAPGRWPLVVLYVYLVVLAVGTVAESLDLRPILDWPIY